MNRLLLAPITFALALVACSSNSNSSDEPLTGAPDAAIAGADLCTNADDVAGREAMYGDDTFDDIVDGCGRDCAGQGGQCTTDCIVEDTGGMVSEPCAGCYGTLVQCAINNCIVPCIADSGSPGCIACRCGDNDNEEDCIGNFATCSGIPTDDCDGV